MLVLLVLVPARGMGIDEFGKGRFAWRLGWGPGAWAASNDSHRVYAPWVDGGDDVVFRRDVRAVNTACSWILVIKDHTAQVVVVARRGKPPRFACRAAACDWPRNVPSGIALAFAKHWRGRMLAGKNVSAKHPDLRRLITNRSPVEKLKLPVRWHVPVASDSVATYRWGLVSKDQCGQCYWCDSLG